ncbi:MAG: hypothetical protein Q9182_004776 [Xanthomendoza sp. 2 TL-2023]
MFHGICTIIKDFGLLLLPIPLVWRLQMSDKKRLGVAAVFAFGTLICAVAIVRQYSKYGSQMKGISVESLRTNTLGTALVSIEFSFSIIVASLPTLTPLVKKMPVVPSWIPTLRSKMTRPSTRQSKLAEPNQDIERSLHSNQYPPASWPTPRPWKEPGEQRILDEYDRGMAGSESDVTLLDLPPNLARGRHQTANEMILQEAGLMQNR